MIPIEGTTEFARDPLTGAVIRIQQAMKPAEDRITALERLVSDHQAQLKAIEQQLKELESQRG